MKKIRRYTWLLFMVAGLFHSCGSGNPTLVPYINYDWAKDKLWDDGQAEMALYHATRIVYGTPRTFEYMYILVKEDFNKEFQVKTDDYTRNDLYPVMKVNKACRIETKAYPYHYLTSIFMKRGDPQTVHKLTNTSQEWCGNTAKSFIEQGRRYKYDYMSYFDGQGNGSTKIEKGPWFEDQLSYTLRTLKFKEGLHFVVDLYPTQVTNQAKIPTPDKAKVDISKIANQELIDVSEDLISDPWKVKVSKSDGTKLTYWINGTYPNYLLKMEATDGRSLLLKEISRDAYWTHE